MCIRDRERTFAAARSLARNLMADDAFALVRVMVEKIINAEFILLSGTDMALDYIQYNAFRAWREFEELQKFRPEIAPAYSAAFQQKLRKAHDQAKTRILPDGSIASRYGRGHDWISIGLLKRAEAVDEKIKKKFSMGTFDATRILYYSTYQSSAAYVHGAWASLARSIETQRQGSEIESHHHKAEDELVEMSVGVRVKDKDKGVAADALNAANMAALSTILFIGKVFSELRYLKWADAFKNTYLDDRRRTRSLSK